MGGGGRRRGSWAWLVWCEMRRMMGSLPVTVIDEVEICFLGECHDCGWA